MPLFTIQKLVKLFSLTLSIMKNLISELGPYAKVSMLLLYVHPMMMN